MKILIDIDEDLLQRAMDLSGIWAVDAVVDAALKEFVRKYDASDSIGQQHISELDED